MATLRRAVRGQLDKARKSVETTTMPTLSARLRKRCIEVPMKFFGSGIYFLLHEGNIVYIGKSIQVAGRVACHLTEQKAGHYTSKKFDRALMMPCAVADLDQIEATLIRFFCPDYNGWPPPVLGIENDAAVLARLDLGSIDPELLRYFEMRTRVRELEEQKRKQIRP